MITLHGPQSAPFVEKVALALALKQLAFESADDADAAAPWTSDSVPVLDIDGERVAGTRAIVSRLDELQAEPALLSRDPRTAEAQRHLVEWVEETFGWYWTRWERLREERPSGDATSTDGPAPASPQSAPPRPAGVSLRSWLGGRLRGSESSSASSDRVASEVRQRLGDTERLLGDRPYFYSDEISMADLAVYSMLVAAERGKLAGSALSLRDRPRLEAFLRRVETATGARRA